MNTRLLHANMQQVVYDKHVVHSLLEKKGG
jgi:hypothetical protein